MFLLHKAIECLRKGVKNSTQCPDANQFRLIRVWNEPIVLRWKSKGFYFEVNSIFVFFTIRKNLTSCLANLRDVQ